MNKSALLLFLTCLVIPSCQLPAEDASVTFPKIGAADKPSLAQFQSLIMSDDSLLAYWLFEKTLDTAKGNLKLRVGGKNPIFRSGPLNSDMSLDLSNGRYASIAPESELDSPELSVEMVFKPKYITSGVLFGMRNGSATRFSVHYEHGSSKLKIWNGSGITRFESDTVLEEGNWYHLALAISAKQSALWINGKQCKTFGDGGFNPDAKGLPLLLGTSEDKAGTSERSEILISHLAIYKRKLATDAIVARMKALGWSEKLKVAELKPVADAAEIEARVKVIKETFGVAVLYQYASKEAIPAVWREVGEPVPIPPRELAKTIGEIEKFLATVPKALTRNCLQEICIFGKLKHGGAAWGKSISVLVNRPDPQTRATLYHEFSHLLQVAYPVPKKPWEAQMPKDFKYGAKTADPFFYDDKLRSNGFIIHYSTSNMHEEFAVLSDYVFVRKEETRDLMEDYPAIKQRVALLIQYYKSIGPEYDFSFYDEILSPKNELDK